MIGGFKMNEDLERIMKLDHEIFMKRCKILKNCLYGRNTEQEEKEVEQEELKLSILRKNYEKNR